MKLTASPFNPESGELLPVYRDAYLNGDLSRESAKAVEQYLGRDADLAHETLNRWQDLQATEPSAVVAPTWVEKQIQFIRTEPVRFRRRAASMVGATVLLGTMVFAGTNLPTTSLPTEGAALTATAALEAAEASSAASSMRLMTVRGRILDEEGAPLVGATVMHAGSSQGVSTNAKGEYLLHVPAGASTLQYGYGGYQDEEITLKSGGTNNVTLLPKKHMQADQEQVQKQKRRWWKF
ncbi:carboxypeptidase-like regulatory domain-containing protein [Hymenobacter tibetensis]|uniref:Carboxypeptidase-like regulatory domain-containing protein n=1 Tax=Hymenobacter tibetensis TaxID=497967 RepID=A0ABY4D081_9BACT|nr:carboxypeptidase-like regulatory domain-containing protein [Hymenobacter tibetensis]UOG75249.1 carboxypeptidase-like regulatory domain-containing protein [Hymenobacter tibetensis]